MKKSEDTDAEHQLFAFLICISFQVLISAKNFCKNSFVYFAPKASTTVQRPSFSFRFETQEGK